MYPETTLRILTHRRRGFTMRRTPMAVGLDGSRDELPIPQCAEGRHVQLSTAKSGRSFIDADETPWFRVSDTAWALPRIVHPKAMPALQPDVESRASTSPCAFSLSSICCLHRPATTTGLVTGKSRSTRGCQRAHRDGQSTTTSVTPDVLKNMLAEPCLFWTHAKGGD